MFNLRVKISKKINNKLSIPPLVRSPRIYYKWPDNEGYSHLPDEKPLAKMCGFLSRCEGVEPCGVNCHRFIKTEGLPPFLKSS